ncbi:Nephrocystin-3 [Durusdinium trenchii]|uniref:Nephrocystin-3 n=1 Tax=Durusdinium trenchii TaxID=1381693 RepID=A0ABP0QJ12_9DINO
MGTWTANLFQSFLDTRREKYGVDNSKTLTSMTHMGGILEKRGQLKGALEHYGEAMHGRREVLGDKHPKTLQSIGKMEPWHPNSELRHGQTYEVGKSSSNMCVLNRSSRGSDSGFSPKHPTREILEALILAQEALFGSKKAYGEQAPDTLDALNNLGSAWKAQGDYKEAEKCFRDAFKMRHESLGPKHPDTLTSLNNLACTVDALGRPSEAGKLYQECLERRRTVLGHSHPDTMTSMSNLALYLRSNGQNEKAGELFEQVLDGRRKIFGIKHMDTIISMNNCASIMLEPWKQRDHDV